MPLFLKSAGSKKRTVRRFENSWLRAPGREDSGDFLPEDRFKKALHLERRRAERSRKLFLLVLFADSQSLGHGHHTRFARGIQNVFSALAASIRETDLWGWYEENVTAGIIFTEFNGTDKPAILATVSEKLDQALRDILPSESLKQLRLSFHFFPENWTDNGQPQSTHELFYDSSSFENSGRVSRVIKRFIDISGSLFALACLSPLVAAIAVAIKMDSKGPVLFKQERIGRLGARFFCLKFRSMTFECNPDIHKDYVKRFIAGEAGMERSDANGKMVFKLARDARVTRVGSFLRKTSLDELPQLFNVLAGQMSLVGPRPPLPYELESYHVWHMRRIFEAKPGITGLWQVMGRSRTTFDEMVRMDLRYAKTWSLWLDVKILVRTPGAVFSGDGAY